MWGLWQCICRKSPFLCIQERIIPTKWLTLRKEVSSIFRKMNVTNSIIKFVSSLAQKKYRDKEGCFVAEGTKCVRDTWQHFDCRMIIATQNWYDTFGNSSHLGKLYIANRGQMQRMSQFATASEVIAVYNIPQPDLEPKAEQDGIIIPSRGVVQELDEVDNELQQLNNELDDYLHQIQIQFHSTYLSVFCSHRISTQIR